MDDKRDSGEILLKVLAGTQLLAEEAGANRNDDQADDQPNGADAPSERPQTGEDPDADAGADKRGDHRSMGLSFSLPKRRGRMPSRPTAYRMRDTEVMHSSPEASENESTTTMLAYSCNGLPPTMPRISRKPLFGSILV